MGKKSFHRVCKAFQGGFIRKPKLANFLSAYILSKAAVNAYTMILAKKYHSVCLGIVKTDMNFYTGILLVEDGAASPVKLALLPSDGPSGLFFERLEVSSF